MFNRAWLSVEIMSRGGVCLLSGVPPSINVFSQILFQCINAINNLWKDLNLFIKSAKCFTKFQARCFFKKRVRWFFVWVNFNNIGPMLAKTFHNI